MSSSRSLVHLLRNIPVRELVRALERDGFVRIRSRRTGGYFYSHPDGRRTVIHYHHGGDTLTRKTLGEVLNQTHWTESDLHRLGLL